MTPEEILKDLQDLKKEIAELQGRGFSIWNASAMIRPVYHIVNDALTILEKIVTELAEDDLEQAERDKGKITPL